MKLIMTDKMLEVVFEGRERYWALKRKLVLSADEIVNMEWYGGLIDRSRLRGLRMPGTSIPGVFHAGSFYRRDGWEFWYMYMNKPGYLVITTNQKKHRMIRLSIDEKSAKKAVAWFEQYLPKQKDAKSGI